ncbi:MAG: hypothetical protein PUH15_05920 [Dialister sp.]|jgi:hypothetical protein|nr:hypothetical protein [Dialister sp.]MCI7054367.1 hypothetical protein [Dialister sp.]MDD7197710.1 hypothetical protein [Dialister sp.]MDY5544401.1 hypothetical protein [Dialister sp.]
MRNEKWWCGVKNNEAPRSFDSASRRRHFERSREIFIAECSLSYIRQRQDIVFSPGAYTLISAMQ